MNETARFKQQVLENIVVLGQDTSFRCASKEWVNQSVEHNYCYNFEWMGRPIIQYPQDIVAMQELIWEMKPDLIVETGIAYGGGLMFYASMLELLGGDGQVIGIEQHIFPEVRQELQQYKLYNRISMLEGNSISDEIAQQIYKIAADKTKVLVALDSCHTHAHVLAELERFSPLVKKGGYIVVFDTLVSHVDEKYYVDRPWNRSNNPKTAIDEFLEHHKRFEIDRAITDKLQISSCPEGFLRCIAD